MLLFGLNSPEFELNSEQNLTSNIILLNKFKPTNLNQQILVWDLGILGFGLLFQAKGTPRLSITYGAAYRVSNVLGIKGN